MPGETCIYCSDPGHDVLDCLKLMEAQRKRSEMAIEKKRHHPYNMGAHMKTQHPKLQVDVSCGAKDNPVVCPSSTGDVSMESQGTLQPNPFVKSPPMCTFCTEIGHRESECLKFLAQRAQNWRAMDKESRQCSGDHMQGSNQHFKTSQTRPNLLLCLPGTSDGLPESQGTRIINPVGTEPPMCVYCMVPGHHVTQCEEFLSQPIQLRRAITNKRRWCFICFGDHKQSHCPNPRPCATCGRKHHPVVCAVPTSGQGTLGPNPIGVESNPVGVEPVFCANCMKSGHKVLECSQFLAQPVDVRWATVNKNRWCYTCFGDHKQSRCSNQRPCETCGGNHHPLMCLPTNSDHLLGSHLNAGPNDVKAELPVCANCMECGHHVLECSQFLSQPIKVRRKIAKKHGWCFVCFGDHVRRNCPNQLPCSTCGGKHHSVVCSVPTGDVKSGSQSTLECRPIDVQPSMCAQCMKPGHHVLECSEFLAQPIDVRITIAKERRWCFICFGNHIQSNCYNPRPCDNCGGRHHRVVCYVSTGGELLQSQGAVESDLVAVEPPLCSNCMEPGHQVPECAEFLSQPINVRRKITKKRRWCLICFGDHKNSNCPNPRPCVACGGKHNPVLCTVSTGGKLLQGQGTLRPNPIGVGPIPIGVESNPVGVEQLNAEPYSVGAELPVCANCSKPGHHLLECAQFLSYTSKTRRKLAMKFRWCFICFGDHKQSQCLNPRLCDSCGERHHHLVCPVSSGNVKLRGQGTMKHSPIGAKPTVCANCLEPGHNVPECSEFLAHRVQVRFAIAKHRGWCFICFGTRHRQCIDPLTCDTCGGRHHPVLCLGLNGNDLRSSPDILELKPVVERPNTVGAKPNPVGGETDPVSVVPSSISEEPTAVGEEPNMVVEEPNDIGEEPNVVGAEPKPDGVDSPECANCMEPGHHVPECSEFLAQHIRIRRTIAVLSRWCFVCLSNHTQSPCPNPQPCKACGEEHHPLLCSVVTGDVSQERAVCANCMEPGHNVSECSEFLAQRGPVKWAIAKYRHWCFVCFGDHKLSNCPNNQICRICGARHHTVLCLPPTGDDSLGTQKTLEPNSVVADPPMCAYCVESGHNISVCLKFRAQRAQERKMIANLHHWCIVCLGDHKQSQCPNKGQFKARGAAQHSVVCLTSNGDISTGNQGALENISVGAEPPVCANCVEPGHQVPECSQFLAQRVQVRWAIASNRSWCLICFGDHIQQQCPNPSLCESCGGRHHLVVCLVPPTSDNLPVRQEESPVCVNCLKPGHHVTICSEFVTQPIHVRRTIASLSGWCFICFGIHKRSLCPNPQPCKACGAQHHPVMCPVLTGNTSSESQGVLDSKPNRDSVVEPITVGMKPKPVSVEPKPVDVEMKPVIIEPKLVGEPTVCANCYQPGHHVLKCSDFLAKQVQARQSIAYSRQLCFICLGSHKQMQCPNPRICDTCGFNHHPVLCPKSSPGNQGTLESTPVGAKSPVCAYCFQLGHHAVKCLKFLALGYQDRKSIVFSRHLCFVCFGDHGRTKCPNPQPCDTCGDRHHPVMCPVLAGEISPVTQQTRRHFVPLRRNEQGTGFGRWPRFKPTAAQRAVKKFPF